MIATDQIALSSETAIANRVADSPMRSRMIFLVGARRSGTNWLFRMLTTHPAIAGIRSETHLFSHGIAPLTERFQCASPDSPTTGVVYMDRERMLDALRTFCDSVFTEFADVVDPTADLLVERTPLHANHLDLISRIYPDAAVVHIIRDGRDVARSLMAQEWGPTTMTDAAREWATAIGNARAAAVPRYREVRYEMLLANPAAELETLVDWLELPAADALSEAIEAEASKAFNVSRGHPGFTAGKWISKLTPHELADFEREAGDVRRGLGYPDVEPTPPEPAPKRVEVRNTIRRAAAAARSVPPRIARRRPVGLESAPPFEMRTTNAYMTSVALFVERFVQLVATREFDGLREMVRPNCEIFVDDDVLETVYGESGVKRLGEALGGGSRPASSLRSSKTWIDALGATVVETHEALDGDTFQRVFVLNLASDQPELAFCRIAYHRSAPMSNPA